MGFPFFEIFDTNMGGRGLLSEIKKYIFNFNLNQYINAWFLISDFKNANFKAHWLFLAVPNHSRLFLTIPDHSWPFLIVPDRSCSFLTVPDRSWPFLTVPDCSWPFLTPKIRLLIDPDGQKRSKKEVTNFRISIFFIKVLLFAENTKCKRINILKVHAAQNRNHVANIIFSIFIWKKHQENLSFFESFLITLRSFANYDLWGSVNLK